ncbi:MAG: nucleotidyltransferase family protein [Methanobacterium sp.]
MDLNFNLKPEDKLLLYCARLNINRQTEENIRYITQQNLDWNYLMKIASKNRLKSSLYFQIKDINIKEVPQNILEDLEKNYQFNVKKNLLFLSELVKILKILEKNGYIIIPYKGPVLTLMIYENLALREFDDLDLYISLRDFCSVKCILEKNGYESTLNLNDSQQTAYFKFQREFMFLNKSNGVPIEIKWKLPTMSLTLNNDPKFLFSLEESIDIELGHFIFKTLSPSNLFLILVIHNAGHFWQRLSWLYDLSELIKNHRINWVKIIKNSEKLGINRILYINLYLIKELFEVDLPPNILKLIKSDKNVPKICEKIVSLLFQEHESQYGENAFSLKFFEMIFLKIKIRECTQNKIKDILMLMFAPTREIIANNSFHFFSFPMYYIFRFRDIIQKYFIDSIK